MYGWLILLYAAAAAKSLQSCPTLCDPIDSSPPGSPVPGILQARRLEWVAISFSNVWKWKVKVKSLSRVRPSATPWTAAYQAPPPMGFSRQEYWSVVPSPSQNRNTLGPCYYADYLFSLPMQGYGGALEETSTSFALSNLLFSMVFHQKLAQLGKTKIWEIIRYSNKYHIYCWIIAWDLVTISSPSSSKKWYFIKVLMRLKVPSLNIYFNSPWIPPLL